MMNKETVKVGDVVNVISDEGEILFPIGVRQVTDEGVEGRVLGPFGSGTHDYPWSKIVHRWADNKRHDWYVPRTNLGAF